MWCLSKLSCPLIFLSDGRRTVSSLLSDTLVPSVSIEELLLPCPTCVMAGLCSNEYNREFFQQHLWSSDAGHCSPHFALPCYSRTLVITDKKNNLCNYRPTVGTICAKTRFGDRLDYNTGTHYRSTFLTLKLDEASELRLGFYQTLSGKTWYHKAPFISKKLASLKEKMQEITVV